MVFQPCFLLFLSIPSTQARRQSISILTLTFTARRSSRRQCVWRSHDSLSQVKLYSASLVFLWTTPRARRSIFPDSMCGPWDLSNPFRFWEFIICFVPTRTHCFLVDLNKLALFGSRLFHCICVFTLALTTISPFNFIVNSVPAVSLALYI
jgi:hypothetical protein